MTRAEAIDYLLDPIGKREKHDEAIRMAIEALEQTQWIPCSERLPEKDTSVLGYIRCASFDYMNVLWRDDYSGDWADGDNFHHEVIAWMPLPKPYEGRTDEQIH